MKLTKLLLSSAAVFGTVSSVNAADAVVAAQSEPLEYVRICDAYGAGYFFISGSETCLKISGYVWSEGIWYNGYSSTATLGTKWHTRAHLQLDTASDTEYGPLKTETIVRWDWNDGGATSTNLLWSYINLGGFTVGKKDSAYDLYTGYAGDVLYDDEIYYGPSELNQLTYNYDAGNGFTAVVSLEDSIDDVSPLVCSAYLQTAACPPGKLKKIERLEDHVIELQKAQILLLFQSPLDAIEREHPIDGEMLANVSQHVDPANAIQPVGIVDHHGIRRTATEGKKTVKYLSEPIDVVSYRSSVSIDRASERKRGSPIRWSLRRSER